MSQSSKRYWYFFFLVLGFFLLGLVKSNCLGAFDDHGIRKTVADDPDTFGDFILRSFVQTNWLINALVSLAYVFFSSLMLYVGYRHRKYWKYSILIYVALILLSLLFISVDIATGKHIFGYTTARTIKDYLIQTPFVVVLLIVAVKVFEGKALFADHDSKNVGN